MIIVSSFLVESFSDHIAALHVACVLTAALPVSPALLLLCCTGVVPACAALDCLTVFARSVPEGIAIMQVGGSSGLGPRFCIGEQYCPLADQPCNTR